MARRFGVGLFLLLMAAGAATATTPAILTQADLPPSLRLARDVRFDGPSHVLVAASTDGLFRVALAPDISFERVVRGGRSQDALWIAARLASSAERVVVASAFFEVVWMDKGLLIEDSPPVLKRDAPLEFIADVDLDGDRLLMLGTRRGENGERSPDGALAWISPLEETLGELRPVVFSQFGPGSQTMDACGTFGLGHVRFFADGRAVIVPGAEPSVFLLDANGKVAQVWDTSALGLDVPCAELDQEKIEELARDPDARSSFLESFETVDEVLPDDSGPILFLRRVEGGATRWRALQLPWDGGEATRMELPFETPSTRSHLRADSHGDRLVFLFFEEDRPERRWGATPRLVVTERITFPQRPAAEPSAPAPAPASDSADGESSAGEAR